MLELIDAEGSSCHLAPQLAELAASEDPRAAVAHFRAVDVEADDQEEEGLPWDQVKKFRVRRPTRTRSCIGNPCNACCTTPRSCLTVSLQHAQNVRVT